MTEYRLLRMRDVLNRTALSRSNIYRRMAAGEFPKSIDLGPRCPRWLESDINAWIDSHRRGPPAVDMSRAVEMAVPTR